jgi:hypothetical protein
MVHLQNNIYFLNKFYANILFDQKYDIYEIPDYNEAYISLTTNRLYVDYKFSVYVDEIIDTKIDYTVDPNYKIDNTVHSLYCFDNIISYNYTTFNTEITLKIKKHNLDSKENKSFYAIMDCPGLDAFGHWIHECFIFCEIYKNLVTLYPNIQILTSNKKRYVKNFLDFIGIKNTIVYEIDNFNNTCFFPPLISLNTLNPTNDKKSFSIYASYLQQFINTININTFKFNFNNKLLYLPRNLVDNYFPSDRIPEHLLFERRNQNEINYISKGIIEDGGIILNTYDINSISVQFSFIQNSQNIILDYGSSFYVNTIFLKDKNIIVLNPLNLKHHIEIQIVKYIHNVIEKNNKVTILTYYNSYEDIAKYLV